MSRGCEYYLLDFRKRRQFCHWLFVFFQDVRDLDNLGFDIDARADAFKRAGFANFSLNYGFVGGGGGGVG